MGEERNRRAAAGPRCRVCHRRLTSSATIAAGIGKQCSRKERGITSRSPRLKIGSAMVESHPDQLEFSFAEVYIKSD
ncbi:DUF6011 domain-containing protein [Geomonas agri]|uniref:DUF6011 domain-containing protein n=1 Tax=Geomonas agri TaxID=2873702 RepID=UPI001CD25D00